MTPLGDRITGTWRRLNGLPPSDLHDARLQAHWAVQPVAAVGLTLGRPRHDDGHGSMMWRERAGLLAGETVAAGFGAALRLRDLTLVVHSGHVVTETLALSGETLDGARKWLLAALRRAAGAPPTDRLETPAYAMPDHPVGQGGRFAWNDPAPFEQLVRWYSNGALLAGVVATHLAGASQVRCRPQRFDVATSVRSAAGEPDSGKERSFTFGMSPGDASYDEPYFYTSLWPAPAGADLPSLAGGGAWHREGWTGGVLRASALTSPAPESQARQVASFVESAISAAREVLA
jgi:hypothetical protein